MVKEINGAGDKTLRVVFEKSRTNYNKETHAYFQKKANIQIQKKKAVVNDNLTQKTQETKIDIICPELDKVYNRKKRRIQNIAKALHYANKREDLITEKFIQDVEALVTRFQTEFDKMQELFRNILQKLPQLQFDVTTT